MEGFIIGNNLQRSGFLIITAMECRNECDGFIFVTAFKVSAPEIVFDLNRFLFL